MDTATFRKAMQDMAAAGHAKAIEAGYPDLYAADFSFGEWAGESEREIVESVTGASYDDLTEDELDELCDAYLSGDAGVYGDDDA